MSLTVYLALIFHIFIAVAVMVMVCGHCGLWPSWYRPSPRYAGSKLQIFVQSVLVKPLGCIVYTVCVVCRCVL